MSGSDRRRPLAFVVLAFVISWGSLGALFAVGPALAAAILAWRDGRGAAVRELLRPILRWRVGGVAYAFILGGPALLGAVTYCLWRAVGAGSTPPAWWLVLAAPGLVIVFGLVALFEEIGWRGYLLPALENRMRPRSAAIAVGAIWGAWHLPLLLITSSSLNDKLPVWAYPAITIPGSLVYAWLYHVTGGSLLAVTLLHGSQQAFVLPLIWNIDRAGGDMASFFSLLVAAVWIVGGVLALVSPDLRLSPSLTPSASAGRAGSRARSWSGTPRSSCGP